MLKFVPIPIHHNSIHTTSISSPNQTLTLICLKITKSNSNAQQNRCIILNLTSKAYIIKENSKYLKLNWEKDSSPKGFKKWWGFYVNGDGVAACG